MALPSLARIPAPPDAILGLSEAARADTRSGKINLSSGVFVDETGTRRVAVFYKAAYYDRRAFMRLETQS